MFQYVDWMSCAYCGRSNCLFKIEINRNHRKKTGNVKYMNRRICRECYRDNVRLKRAEWLANPITREKINKRQRELRKLNPERYAEYQSKNYLKYREERLEYNRNRKRTKKVIPDIVLKARMRESLRVTQYTDGSQSNTYRRRKNKTIKEKV